MSVHARCRVGGCDWETTAEYRVQLVRLAELHRRRFHFWVKPNDLDRLCRVTLEVPDDEPEPPAPTRQRARMRRSRQ